MIWSGHVVSYRLDSWYILLVCVHVLNCPMITLYPLSPVHGRVMVLVCHDCIVHVIVFGLKLGWFVCTSYHRMLYIASSDA